MKLSEAIAYHRANRGLTLRQVATKSGLSNSLISQIERGRVPDPGFSTVVKLAKALRVPLKRLAGTDPG